MGRESSPPNAALAAPRWRLAALLAAVVVFKLVYLVQYARLPFLKAPIYDSVVYLRQARAILGGRFSDATLLAFSPLYGYYLAAVGGADHVGPPILGQLALGCLNLYVIFRIVRPRFGETAALISAALYFGYGLILSFESKLMSETLGLTLALLALGFYLSPGYARGRLPHTVAAGGLVALSILARASLLFAAPCFLAASLLPWSSPEPTEPTASTASKRSGLRRQLVRTVGFSVGLAAVLVGNGLWNRAHTGLFVPVILVSKTVAKTTAADFNDDFSTFSNNERGQANAFDVVQQAEERLAAQRRGEPQLKAESRPLWGIDVLGWLRGAPLKLAHTFSDEEVSFDYGYFGERKEVRALAMLPVSFGMIVMLGVVGASFLGLRHGGWALVPFLPYFVGTLLTTTLFHSSSRYRLPMVLPLILLAGFGVVQSLQLPQRRLRLALCAGLAVACLGFAVKTVTYKLRVPVTWELRVAQSAAIGGDQAELARRLERAARLAPGNPDVRRRIELFAKTGGISPPAP